MHLQQSTLVTLPSTIIFSLQPPGGAYIPHFEFSGSEFMQSIARTSLSLLLLSLLFFILNSVCYYTCSLLKVSKLSRDFGTFAPRDFISTKPTKPPGTFLYQWPNGPRRAPWSTNVILGGPRRHYSNTNGGGWALGLLRARGLD